jgi:hypothetical protein
VKYKDAILIAGAILMVLCGHMGKKIFDEKLKIFLKVPYNPPDIEILFKVTLP